MTSLLNHLLRSPNDPSAAQLRDTVDLIFALNGRDGGIIPRSEEYSGWSSRPLTEGGREAWDYLRRLRTRAWRKAGLDPDIVWARNQALQACNSSSEVAQGSEQNTYEEREVDARSGQNIDPDVGPMQAFSLLSDVMASPPDINWDYMPNWSKMMSKQHNNRYSANREQHAVKRMIFPLIPKVAARIPGRVGREWFTL